MLAVLGLAGMVASAVVAVEATPKPEAKNIVETAAAAENFKTLVKLIEAAGLTEALKGAGPFTVFAPSDEAFAKLPKETLDDLQKPENKEKLAGILKYHVVGEKLMAADVMKKEAAKTLQGADVKFTTAEENQQKVVKVNDAKVVTADCECSNGVIHAVDTVLMPPAPPAPTTAPAAK